MKCLAGARQTVSLNLSEQATGIYFIVLQDDTGTLRPRAYLNRQLMMGGYSTGMYIIQVRSGTQTFNKKILVQH